MVNVWDLLSVHVGTLTEKPNIDGVCVVGIAQVNENKYSVLIRQEKYLTCIL